MKYCSIEEAWGNNFKSNDKFEIQKPHNNSIEFLTNNSTTADHAIKLYEGFTATGEYKENVNNKFDKYLEKFDYLMKYKPFRNKIIERMENILGKKQNVEHFSLSCDNKDDYSDVLLLIIFGIFIIFVLDSFVKLGMRYTKS